jgi:hypothetical protein
MRYVKLITGLILVLAFSAFAVATASAEEVLWRWLPGSAKETFKALSGSIKLQEVKEGGKGGAAYECKKTELLLADELKEGTVHSELLEKEARLALAVAVFTGCSSAGLAMESLGDPAGTILVHYEIHNCLIAKGDQGLLIKPLPVHLEVLAIGLLSTVEGSFVALISKKAANEFALTITQKEGKQAIEKCEGGKADTLLLKNGSEPQRPAGEELTGGVLLFDKALDKEEVLDES